MCNEWMVANLIYYRQNIVELKSLWIDKTEVKLHIFITSALDGSDWSVSHSTRLVPRKGKPSTYCVGSCVSPRGDLEILENKLKKKYFE